MRLPTEKNDDLDLDLPALDGEDDVEQTALADEDLDIADDGEDPLDDATADDGSFDERIAEGSEGGWLVDAEASGSLDVGPLDVVLAPEGPTLDDDDVETKADLEDLISAEESFVADSGEEGPLAEDEELREEDLPALDADEDGDVSDDDLYDRGLFLAEDEVRWDDRAWARACSVPPNADEIDDSGVLATPGDDPAHSARDAAWKRLEEGGRVMASTFVPGGSVVLAIATSDRARAFVVRIQPDGKARIIAEIDPRTSKAEDDGEVCTVTFLRWDTSRACLFVGGNFGVEAYRPV